MSGLVAVDDVTALLPKEHRMAIEARGAELLREVERRQEQKATADSSAPLRNDKQEG